MKLALVGASGLVGSCMLKVLEERNFEIDELIPVASERSIGKTVNFKSKQHKIVSIEEAISKAPTLALFSAGGSTSLTYAEKFAAIGTTVIDNSSAWRMHPNHKLIIPEVNGSKLTSTDKIIANPNCSTIQMIAALAPLHAKFQIDRLVISTYQSITGTGVKAIEQLEAEEKGETAEMVYPYPIYRNCIPQCDVFEASGYTKEELKLINESKKILDDNSLKITATAVRIPVVGGHSEAINVSFKKAFELDEVRSILSTTNGIIVQDDPKTNLYPMPITANDKDEVFVGRIRRDESAENCLNMWIVSDNLRKGAATNAVQIAEYLIDNQLI